MVPIWQDYIIDVDASEIEEGVDRAVLRIQAVMPINELIYVGYCYKINNRFKANVTDIIRNYIFHSLDYLINKPLQFKNQLLNQKLEIVIVLEDSHGEHKYRDTDYFYYDYCHEYEYRDGGYKSKLVDDIPIHNITKKIKNGMPLIFTINNEDCWIKYISGDFNNDFNNDFFSSGEVTTYIPWERNYAQDIVMDVTNFKFIEIYSMTSDNLVEKLNVVQSNSRYAVYYLNAHGGVDFLLLEGECEEFENYKRYQLSKNYDNNLLINRGIEEYLNEVTKGWVLRTGYLTAKEHKEINNLLGSPKVYLLDMEMGTPINPCFIPINIKNSTVSIKTHRGNGGKFFQVTINADLAKRIERR